MDKQDFIRLYSETLYRACREHLRRTAALEQRVRLHCAVLGLDLVNNLADRQKLALRYHPDLTVDIVVTL